MERFKRGDESRTTDGSGLGLAIAKDLLKLQNGRLDIVIDGDLFKATAVLKAAETPASEIENGPSEEEEPEGDAEDGRDQER
jgi:signal transduction histidine kinase